MTLLPDLAELSLGEGSEEFAAGPFRIASFDHDGFSASAFERYYRGRPGVNQIEFRGFPSLRSAWAALLRGELDVLYDVGRDAVEFVEQDVSVHVYPFLRPYPATLFFNSQSPQFSDHRVRLALARAVDTAAVVKGAFRGRARLAKGPLWPQHWAVQGLAPVAAFDPAMAGRLLSETGYTSQHRKVSTRLSFKCLVVAIETQPFERIALLLQKQFFDVGIDMELELVPPQEFVQRLSVGNFEAALFESAAFTTSWVYSFFHSPAPDAPVWIRHGYSGADAELDAMQNARNEDELKRAVAAVYRKMAEDPPAIFIAWPEVARAVSTRFEVPVEKGRDIMGGNLWLWRPAKQH